MSFIFTPDFPEAEKPFSVAIIKAEFNDSITDKLLESTVKGLNKCSVDENAIEVYEVPGALEIPFTAQKLIETGDFDGVIALGTVIRGKTYHFEIVAQESARGITNLNVLGKIPIINGILTVENEEQAWQRIEKGVEYAKNLVQMMNMGVLFQKGNDTSSIE